MFLLSPYSGSINNGFFFVDAYQNEIYILRSLNYKTTGYNKNHNFNNFM